MAEIHPGELVEVAIGAGGDEADWKSSPLGVAACAPGVHITGPVWRSLVPVKLEKCLVD
jgi:hypothetical protein